MRRAKAARLRAPLSAEQSQAVQRLILGTEYRKDGVKTYDVKDLLDRILQGAKDNLATCGSHSFGRDKKDP